MANEQPHLHVRFFSGTKENPIKTAEAGRPIFDDIEMVRIRVAGDRHNELVAPAHIKCRYDRELMREVTYAERFPDQYDAFRRDAEQVGSGTPLSQLPFLTPARREELKRVKVHTAEALASLDGRALSSLGMDGRKLKDQAQSYLDDAAASAGGTELAAENEALRKRLEALEAQIAAPATDVGKESPAVTTKGEFADFTRQDLREYIKEQTGASPKGNPSDATLLQMAEEIASEVSVAA